MATVAEPRIITSTAFHDALVTAGVIRGGESYQRIVIVADGNDGLVRIYAERLGDERLLGVVLTLDGVEVTYGNPGEDDGQDRAAP